MFYFKYNNVLMSEKLKEKLFVLNKNIRFKYLYILFRKIY